MCIYNIYLHTYMMRRMFEKTLNNYMEMPADSTQPRNTGAICEPVEQTL